MSYEIVHANFRHKKIIHVQTDRVKPEKWSCTVCCAKFLTDPSLTYQPIKITLTLYNKGKQHITLCESCCDDIQKRLMEKRNEI